MITAPAGRLRGRLLVVDFDFFFPNPSYSGSAASAGAYLFDWGHQETLLHRELIWPARAAAFTASGQPLPRCGGIDSFWHRFHLNTDTLLVADSNTYAGNLTPPDGDGFSEVVLFDAHHDSGYRRTLEEFTADGCYSCEDWTYVHHQRGSTITVRYPRWLPNWQHCDPTPRIPIQRATDDDAPMPHSIDVAFCCRSGSWVPPWCDDQWNQLLAGFPGHIQNLDPTLHRPRWNQQRQQDYQRVLTTITAAQADSRPEARHPRQEP